MIETKDIKESDVGKHFYAYCFELSKRRGSLQKYSGIVEVELTKCYFKKCDFGRGEHNIFYLPQHKFKVVGKELAYTTEDWLMYTLDNHAKLYETKEECIEEHDKDIIDVANNRVPKKEDRLKILKKVINKDMLTSPLEIESLKWYEELDEKTKEMVDWLIENK